VKVAAFISIDIVLVQESRLKMAPFDTLGIFSLANWWYDAYVMVETEDQQRIAPGNDVLRKVFGDRSILLLLDEFCLR